MLAGGKGTRLAPYTTVLPKPLMPIGEMPVLEILLRRLALAGFDHVHLAVGYLAQLIEAYFGDGSRFGVDLHYLREEEPLGTAGPLAEVEGDFERLLVMNGDLFTAIDFGALVDQHVSSGVQADARAARAPGSDRLRRHPHRGRPGGRLRGEADDRLRRQHGRLRLRTAPSSS